VVALNVPGLPANTTRLLNSIQSLIQRLRMPLMLRVSSEAQLTRFRAVLRNVTAPLLVRLRLLSASKTLTGTSAKSQIAVLIRGARSLRGLHSRNAMCSQARRVPSSVRPVPLPTPIRVTFPDSNGAVVSQPTGSSLSSSSRPVVGSRPTGARTTAARTTAARPTGTRTAGSRPVAGSRRPVPRGVVRPVDAQSTTVVRAADTVTVAANAFYDEANGGDAQVSPATSASNSQPLPGWAVALVVVASLATIALVVIAGLLVVRIKRSSTA